MTEHVEIGHAILLAAELPIEAHWVLHHHERYRRRAGIPSGLRAARDPDRVADHRRRRRVRGDDRHAARTATAMPVDEAIVELQANSGTQFDSRCVDALVDVVNEAATEADLVGIAHGGTFKVPLVPRPTSRWRRIDGHS